MNFKFGMGPKHRLVCRVALLLFAVCLTARAALQFDVFPGYDYVVPEASWFPVVCEIKNDGPPFNAVIEITPGSYSQGQVRDVKIELPTGTLKRLTIPVFCTTRNYSTWDVRLIDERGKVRAELNGVRPNKQVASGTPLIGALARSANGAPSLRPIKPTQSELQPAVARLQTSIFPDNPLVLEGMDTLYLSSEKAPELRVPNQVEALYGWLNSGGHLIVSVEQLADINSTPWLRNLIPMELKDIQTLPRHPEFQEWLRSPNWMTNSSRLSSSRANTMIRRPGQRMPAQAQIPALPDDSAITTPNPITDLTDDYKFETAGIQVATGKIKEGHTVLSAEDTPLIVTANHGRGRVTVLLFSPEREPFRSWKNLPTFWSKLSEIPAAWYASADFSLMPGLSSDGVFGAMIDSRQVHKLPVEWLLLLLIVYLVVIGPLDQYWLKRIGRPMLTWITFPCYVVMFSLLIYFIGYKLRAGESEWNELHLVDVLMNGDHAELRGRTYSSVYAPANQRFDLRSEQKYATFRAEFAGSWGGQSTEKVNVLQVGDGFKADIFVPVWTSQLFVSDWWQPSATPISATVTPNENGWQVKVDNHTDQKLTSAKIALENVVATLGEIPAKESRTFNVAKGQGTNIRDYVFNYGREFAGAVQSRQQAFGARESGRISNLPDATVAASFISQLRQAQDGNYMNNFLAAPGLDMTAVVEHGGAILFAWADDFGPVKPLYQFTPRRSHKYTMWRVPIVM